MPAPENSNALLIDVTKKVFRLGVVAIMFVALGCSSSGPEQGVDKELDAAIGLYIEGEYEKAVPVLTELTRRLDTESEIQTAYLYLGRCHMSLGDYVAAADAFSSGRILGGGIEFDQHLAAAQQHLRSTPRFIRAQAHLTRGQLAALIDNLFTISFDTGSASVVEPSDVVSHWAREYVVRVAAVDIMRNMPDGKFYPDASVTYPAFYVVLQRSARYLGVSGAEVDEFFPSGFRGAVGKAPGDGSVDINLVSGEEATEILQSLVLKASD